MLTLACRLVFLVGQQVDGKGVPVCKTGDHFMDPVDHVKRKRLLQPWEQGFAGLILGGSSFRKTPAQRFLDQTLHPAWGHEFIAPSTAVYKAQATVVAGGPESETPAVASSSSGGAFTVAARSRKTKPWKLVDDAARHRALARWNIIVMENPEGSRLGLQLLAIPQGPEHEAKTREVVEHTFHSKSTKTLASRSGALLMYLRWFHSGARESKFAFPISEPLAYDYMCFLVASGAPASRGSSFREATAFALGVVGYDSEESLKSRRCHGASMRLMSKKRVHLQRDPFTVAQVEALERGVFELDNAQDRLFAGHCVFMVLSRTRFSDTHYVDSEPVLDVDAGGTGYVECRTVHSKTSNKKQRRGKALPLVASARGLLGKQWAGEWLKLRRDQGLVLSCTGPLLPAIGSDGCWKDGRMTSSEASLWCAEILLRLGAPLLPGQVFGTHTAKATVLSWMSKAGLPLSTRRVAGYHTRSSDDVTLLYSRDAMAGPLRMIDQLLESVANRSFLPDATRSGRWCKKSKPSQVEVVAAVDEDDEEGPARSLHSGSPGPVGTDKALGDGWTDHSEMENEVIGVCKFPSCRTDDHPGFCGMVCYSCELSGCSDCFPIALNSDGDAICESCRISGGLWGKLSVVADFDSTSDSSLSEGGGENSSDTDCQIVRAEMVAARACGLARKPARGSSQSIFQHPVLKTLHLGKANSTGLACGRPSEAFRSLQEFPIFDCHRCKICFGDRADSDDDVDEAEPPVKLEEFEEPQQVGSEDISPQGSPSQD